MPFDPQPPVKDDNPFVSGGDFQVKPSKFEKFCLFPIKAFPFSEGFATRVFGLIVQIAWSLILLAVGLGMALGSLCLGCIVLANLGIIH